jgi:hypothetical protein
MSVERAACGSDAPHDPRVGQARVGVYGHLPRRPETMGDPGKENDLHRRRSLHARPRARSPRHALAQTLHAAARASRVSARAEYPNMPCILPLVKGEPPAADWVKGEPPAADWVKGEPPAADWVKGEPPAADWVKGDRSRPRSRSPAKPVHERRAQRGSPFTLPERSEVHPSRSPSAARFTLHDHPSSRLQFELHLGSPRPPLTGANGRAGEKASNDTVHNRSEKYACECTSLTNQRWGGGAQWRASVLASRRLRKTSGC